MSSHDTPPQGRSDLGVIQSCLGRIRLRLRLVRLGERATVALIAAAGTALILSTARFLHRPHFTWATVLAVVPLAIAAFAYLESGRLARIGAVLRKFPLFLVVAAGLSVATIVCMHFPFFARLPFWALPAACLAAMLVPALLTAPRISPRAAAIFVDRRAGLKERVSTAWEYAREGRQPIGREAEFIEPLLASAAEACLRVRSTRVGYHRLDRRAYAAAAAATIAALSVAILSPLPARGHASHPNTLVVAKAQDLAKAIEEIEKKNPAHNDPVADNALQILKRPVTEINRQQDMTNLDALEHLKTAQQDLKNMEARQDAAEKAKDMLGDDPLTRDLAKAINDLKDANLKSARGEQDAQQARAKAEEALGQAMQDLAGKTAGMSGAERQKTADALKKAADAASGDQQLQQSLNQASQACSAGDESKMGQSLKDAANEMGRQGADKSCSGEQIKQEIAQADRMAQALGAAGESPSGDPGGDSRQAQSGDGGNPSNPDAQQPGQNGAKNGDQQANQGGGKDGNKPDGSNQAGADQGGNKPGDQTSPQASAGQGPMDSHEGGGGSTNFEGISGPGGKNHGDQVGKEGKFAKVYGERPVDTQGPDQRATANLGSGRSAGSVDIHGGADASGRPLTEFADQLPAERQLLQAQMDNGRIPPKYHPVLERYFSQGNPAPAPPGK